LCLWLKYAGSAGVLRAARIMRVIGTDFVLEYVISAPYRAQTPHNHPIQLGHGTDAGGAAGGRRHAGGRGGTVERGPHHEVLVLLPGTDPCRWSACFAAASSDFCFTCS